MTQNLQPVLKSFLLCRQVLSDPNNGQISLINLVHAVKPRVPETFFIYMTLTEVPDNCEFRLSFEMQPETIDDVPEQVFETIIPRHPDPHEERLCMYHIGRRFTLSFPRDGTCNIHIYSNDQLIDSFPLECSSQHVSHKHVP